MTKIQKILLETYQILCKRDTLGDYHLNLETDSIFACDLGITLSLRGEVWRAERTFQVWAENVNPWEALVSCASIIRTV